MAYSHDYAACEKCCNSVVGNKWARIRAAQDGWLFMKDGRAYCPGHLPAWVMQWRKRKQERKGNR